MSEYYKVYIGNLPEDVRDRDVEKLLKNYGRVDNIVLKVLKQFKFWSKKGLESC